VARRDDIAALADGQILDMARGDFRWRVGVPADGHLSGDIHPADSCRSAAAR
jgi:hypothetical protein